MLIGLEVKIKLPVIGIFNLSNQRFEKLVNVILDKQRMSEDAHDLHDGTANLMIMFNDTNETVCDDGHMYLNADSILTLAPKALDLEMLLDPLEEQLHLSSVLVEKRDLTSLEIEVVRIVCERPFQVWSIINNASNRNRIVALVPSASESDSLVPKDIILSLKNIFTLFNVVVRMELLSDNEESTSFFNGKESCKVKVSPIKDIACKRLIFNPVHRVDIMDTGSSDSIEYRNLCSDINLRVNPDARLCGSELGPSKNCETEFNDCRVNGIESSMKFKLPGDTKLLSLANHIEGKLLKNSVITESIGLGDDVPVRNIDSESEMVRSFSMGSNDIYKFTKTGTARKLSEYKHTKKVPMGKRPSLRPVVVPLYNTVELTFEWRDHLLKHISSGMHICSNLNLDAKVSISNAGQCFQDLIYCT